MSLNALDTALVSLANASTALEYINRPTLKDIERARDKAKDAHEILDASAKLLKRGIYTVADAPPVETPLFASTGEPAANVHTEEPPAAAPLSPDLPTLGMNANLDHALSGMTEEEAQAAFDAKLELAESAWLEQGKKLKAFKAVRKAWAGRYAYNPAAAYDALTLALDTPGHDLLPPQQEEASTEPKPLGPVWPTPDFENTPLEDLIELFANGPMDALGTLIDGDTPEGEQREALKITWENSFDANPADTWFAAIAVLASDTLPLSLPDPLPAAPKGSAA